MNLAQLGRLTRYRQVYAYADGFKAKKSIKIEKNNGVKLIFYFF